MKISYANTIFNRKRRKYRKLNDDLHKIMIKHIILRIKLRAKKSFDFAQRCLLMRHYENDKFVRIRKLKI